MFCWVRDIFIYYSSLNKTGMSYLKIMDFKKFLSNSGSVLMVSLDRYLRNKPLGECVMRVFCLPFTDAYVSGSFAPCVSVCGSVHVNLDSVVLLSQIQREILHSCYRASLQIYFLITNQTHYLSEFILS